ncbi:MAG: PAS domain S-box protein [Candidatus Omnitrophota bacterium]
MGRDEVFDDLFEQIETPIFLVNVVDNGDFIYEEINPALEKALSLSKQEIIGKRPEDIPAFSDEMAETARANYKHCVKSGHPYCYEEKRVIDGKETWWTIQLSPQRGESEKIIRLIGAAFDITNRKRKEEDLRIYQNIVSSTNDIISLVDKQYTYRVVNDSYLRFHQKKREEIVGRTVAEILGEKVFRETVKEKLDRCLKGETIQYRSWFQYPVLGRRLMEMTYSPYKDEYGVISGIVVNGKDVTEIQRAQDTLLERLDYERAAAESMSLLVKSQEVDEQLPRILNILRLAVNVSRAYIFRNEDDPDAGLCMTQIHEAVAENIPPQIGNPSLQHLPYREGAPTLLSVLQTRRPFARIVADMQGLECEILEAQNILSLLILPIYCGNEFWGLIGFDDCETVRAWREEDINLLQAVADGVGAAILRQQSEKAVRISEERFRALFENSPIPIWEEDFSAVKGVLDGLKDMGVDHLETYLEQHPDATKQCAELVRITNVNQAALEMHEAACKEELFKGLIRTFTPESYKTFRSELIALWNGRKEMASDAVIRTLSGKPKQVTIYFAVCPGHEQTLSKVLVSIIDITERKQAEERLMLLNFALDHVCEAAFLVKEDARFIYVNENACQVLGYERDELLGLSVPDIDPDYPMERWRDHWKQLKTRHSITFETRHKTKDSRLIPVEMSVNYFEYDGQGYNLGLARDIADRKRAEQERSAYLHFFENMDRINRAIQGVNDLERMMSDVLDEALSILDCDRASLVYPCDPEAASWRAPMERTRKEYPGLFALGMDIPMNADAANVFRTLLASNVPVKFGPPYEHSLPAEIIEQFHIQSQIAMAIYPKIDKPYMFVLHQCSYQRIWTPDEEILFQEIGRRITDGLTSLLSHRNLMESEKKYRSLFEDSFDGLFITSPEGKILDVNKKGVSMFGYSSKEEVQRLDLSKDVYKSPLDRQRVLSIADAQGFAEYEIGFKKKNGDKIIVQCSLTAQKDEKGEVVAYRSILRDITESKRAQNIMQARLRLLEFAPSHAMDELLTAALDEMEALTESSIGFYHFLESDQQTLSLQSWSTNTLKNMCTAAGKGSHYHISQAGVWVDCVHERRPVIHNDYAALPHRKGMPEGHAPVTRELVVPIFRGDSITAIIGVGNKSVLYNENDIEIVSTLGDLSWDIVERKRAEERIRMQLDELQRWHDVTLNREDRVQDLKREVNELMTRLGEPVRYASAAE